MDPKIDGQFFYQNYVPTIRKRRYIDNHTGGKLFELYTIEETALDEEVEQNLLNNDLILVYLNRLADTLFALARYSEIETGFDSLDKAKIDYDLGK